MFWSRTVQFAFDFFNMHDNLKDNHRIYAHLSMETTRIHYKRPIALLFFPMSLLWLLSRILAPVKWYIRRSTLPMASQNFPAFQHCSLRWSRNTLHGSSSTSFRELHPSGPIGIHQERSRYVKMLLDFNWLHKHRWATMEWSSTKLVNSIGKETYTAHISRNNLNHPNTNTTLTWRIRHYTPSIRKQRTTTSSPNRGVLLLQKPTPLVKRRYYNINGLVHISDRVAELCRAQWLSLLN